MPPSAADAIEAVVAAVEQGRIPRERIDASVRRILYAKLAAGLDDNALTDTTAFGRMLDNGAHDAWAEDVAARSLTLVRLANGALPLGTLPDGTPMPVTVVAYDESSQSHRGTTFVDAVSARGHDVRLVRVARNSTAAQLQRAEEQATGIVVFLSFSNAAPWRGRLGLPERVAPFANRLARRGALIFNFGDPYILAQVPAAETYLLAWAEDPVMERAAARALVGEVRVSGMLPISLEGYDLGTGVTLPALTSAAAAPAVPDWRPIPTSTGY